MRKRVGLGLLASLALVMVAVGPASAAPRGSVHIDVATNFDPGADPFTATGIPGCASGVVADGANTTNFTRPHGVFAGYKVFDCGGGTGFALRLNAIFSYSGGSTGSWAVVDAWGTLAGLQGSGKLVGTPAGENAIDDAYDGTIN